jgi:hypothetical protein
MSELESIKTQWRARVSKVYTTSDKGAEINPGDIYCIRTVEVTVGGRTTMYETAMLTQKEYFIEQLQGKT